MARLFFRRDVTFSIIGLLFVLQAVIRYGSHVSPEVGWYLYAGGRLLDGAALYQDVVEVNPPLALWLCAAIVAVARAIGVEATVLFQTVLLLVTVASLAISGRLLAAATDVTAATRHLILILAAALLLFVPASDFGQRDHVVVLLALPWVLLRWNRLLDREVPWMLAAIVAVSAALGLWLKPHFVIVLIAVEVTMLFTSRNVRSVLRVETVAVVVFGIAYMAAIRLLWPTSLLAKIALLGSRAYIPNYGVALEDVLTQLILALALAAVAVASARLLTEQLNLLRSLVFVAGSTFACVYVLQAGNRYQIVPGLSFLALAAGFCLARVVAGEVRLVGLRLGLVAAGAAVAISAVFASVWTVQVAPYSGRIFEEAISAEAPGARTILIASAESAHSFPLVNDKELIWASRFPSLWLSVHVANKLDEDGAPIDDIARFELETTVSDLIDFQPDIVFVNEAPERPRYTGAPLDYVRFWNNDIRFQRFWRAYERRGMAGEFGVYVRVDPPPS